jgi:teichuronic acid biosynthesis glycosyltransferase TuaG
LSSLVSIITPSFNSARFIKECIDSVLSQTYADWELLIVDDCSKDNSKELLFNIEKKDPRVKVTFLDNNIGSAEARNIAIRQAKGKYIAFLDSDDYWEKEKLANQIEFMKSNDIAFSFSSYIPISEDGKVFYSPIFSIEKIGYHDYLKNTIIGCLTVVIDREKTGDFEMPNIRSSHDMALWLIIMKRGFYAYGLNENLAKYRNVSISNTASKWRAAKDVWMVYRKIEKLSFLYSFWCFLNYAFNAIIKRI